MDEDCTIYKTAEIVGKKWTLIILLEIYKGENKKKRYNELKDSLPKVTSKMLSLRLKELEDEKMIKKSIDTTNFPIKCEYELTKEGLEFIPIIKTMKRWALKNKFDNKLCSSSDCKHCLF